LGVAEVKFSYGADPKEIEWADAVIYQRHYDPGRPFAWWKALTQFGKPRIYELDDDIFAMPKENPFEQYFTPEVKQCVKTMLREADLVTCSTDGLAASMSRFNPKTAVIPNGIDSQVFDFPVDRRPDRVRVFFIGSRTHDKDYSLVEKALHKCIRLHPEMDMVFVGQPPVKAIERFPSQAQVYQTGWVPFEDLYVRLAKEGPDIVIAPLTKHPFNLGKCVVGGTLVATENGIVPISELSTARLLDCVVPLGQNVITPSGVRVATHFYYGGEVDTVVVTTESGFQIEGTPDHRVCTQEKTWKPLGDVVAGDVMQIVPMSASERYVSVPYNPWQMKWPTRTGKAPDHSAPSLPQVWIDEYWGSVLGYIVGDGHVGPNYVKVTCDAQDSDVAEDVKATFDAIGMAGNFHEKASQNRKAVNVVACSAQLVHFVERLGLVRDKRRYVDVPDVILRSPRSVIAAFLRALFESDGTVGRPSVSLRTKSYQVARKVQALLTVFGIVAQVRERVLHSQNAVFRKYNGNTYYQVCLRRAGADVFQKEIGFVGARKKSRLLEITSKPHSNAYREQTWAEKVVDVQRSRGDVFDITVPDGEWFVAGCMVNHNSAIKFIESGALGAVCIASPVSDFKKYVVPGETGWLPDSDTEWEAAIEWAIRNTEGRQRMAAKAKEFVKATFSYEVIAPKWVEAVRKVVTP
jgi:glycosyltransferase involved in cell wall biosynthesis